MAGCYRASFSSTPSVGSDAPIPETLEEGDSVNTQIPPQASPEAEQATAKGPKIEPLDYQTDSLREPETSTEEENTPTEAPPVDGNGSWMVFIGNLHPRTTPAELYELLDGRESVRNIVIRSTRGCGVVIPDEAMTTSDRCYASVEFNGFGATWEALNKHDPKNPLILHGLPIIIKLSPADMPEVSEILERTMGYLLENKSKSKRTKRRVTRRRLAIQKTEVSEDQQRPLAGPSRRTRAHRKLK